MQPTLFHNTISLSGPELVEAEKKCSLQEERILEIMTKPMTPFEVHAIYQMKYNEIPITSVRRGITNLTNRGKLIMCEEMKLEQYGKNNHLWRKP